MVGAIICAVIVLVALEHGEFGMAVFFGVLAVIFFRNRKKPDDSMYDPKKANKPTPVDTSTYHATPSMVQKYINHPITADILQGVLPIGTYEKLSFDRSGCHLQCSRYSGGTSSYYTYDFQAHNYQPATIQEQEAILIALSKKLPYGSTYKFSYEHYEDSEKPLCYSMKTDRYKNCRWNDVLQQWQQLRNH